MTRWFRICLAAALCAVFLLFVFETLHWRWMNDAQVPHYVVFLMRHGFSPYRQITDINLPGSYLSDWIGMSFPGGSDVAWRLYDYSLLLMLTVAAMVIASSYDWLAGLYGGVLFAVMHASEGPWFTADRDEVMTVLVLCAFAAAFVGVRRLGLLYFFVSAVLFGLACTIKPTAALAELILFVPLFWELRKREIRILPFARMIVLGTSVVLLAVFLFLFWRGSAGAFFTKVPSLTRYYASSDRMAVSGLVRHSASLGLAFLLPITILLFVWNRSWRRWEIQAVVGGCLFGLISYFVQGKGFPYHRYPFMAFALLWTGMECVEAMRNRGMVRWLGAGGLVAGGLLIAPFYLHRVPSVDKPDLIAKGIANDLQRFPDDKLQGSVQCLDSVYGCYSALYRLGLVQSTGLMGDQLLFPHKVNATILQLRREFGDEVFAHPPNFFVETNAWPWGPQTFAKIEAWPEFAEFLRKNYTVVSERTYPLAANDTEPAGYRIYYRKQ